LGVFSKKYIAEGTVLGKFPGYMMSSEDALTSKEDEKAKLSARKFLFIVNNEEVIDPTNKAGLLELELTYLGGLIKVDTLVARINQPPLGKKINVYTKINGPDAVVMASKVFTYIIEICKI
jgi:hypothetical protein